MKGADLGFADQRIKLLGKRGAFMRRYPGEPSVAVGGIVLEDGCILLVKRGNPPSKGLWGLPGGSLEIGEPLRDGVARELREECGIEVEVGELFDVFETIVKDPAGRVEFHYVILDFFASRVSGEVRPGDDVDDCRFIPLIEARDYGVTPGVEELLRKMKARGIY